MAQTQNRTYPSDSVDDGVSIGQGVIGGIIGGLVFAGFEMMAAAMMEGGSAFFMPLRMIGAIALGPAALEPSYSLVTAGSVGVAVHMVLSMVYGAVFGAVALWQPLRRSATAMVLAATAFGFLLWLVNFYMIAPAAGWTWFPENTSPIVQFVGHTFFFGTVLGLYLARRLRR